MSAADPLREPTVLDPIGSGQEGTIRDQVRDFEIEISTDGSTFTPVLSGSLSGGQWEQGFALDRTIDVGSLRRAC